jgi:acetylornithine deacetylase/succinyl-diaminopimelate desuccinylase-like protein
MKKYLVAISLGISTIIYAQEKSVLDGQVMHSIEEIIDFVSIPNDALEHADINRNLTWLTKKFNERGFNTSLLPTAGESLFFAALPMQEGKPTLLVYMHFDGQSVDASKWNQPSPYKVVIKSLDDSGAWTSQPITKLSDGIQEDWRLFGRSVSDDKGPIVMLLNALDLTRKTNAELPFNLKVILDGEEERGSVPLAEAVEIYRELLQADALLIGDGPMHFSGEPTVVYGCRGITSLTLTTYGPVRPQHSGHFGNYAPNPNFQLAEILSGMKDHSGRVTLPGYYDGIELSTADQEVLKSVPDDIQRIHADLQISVPDQVGSYYQEALQYPSLNIRGMASGWVGEEARTIVPATATAELDLRLVVESDGNRLKRLVKEHIKRLGYEITDTIPNAEMRASGKKWVTISETGVTKAFRTPLDHPFGKHLVTVLNSEFGKEVVQIRTSGGTVPIAPFVNALKIPALILPMVNADNNQHSPNENLRIGQISYGLRALNRLLSTPLEF